MDQLSGAAFDDFVRRVGKDAQRLGADVERLLDRLVAAVKAEPSCPWASFQRPGDIVLTRGRRPISHLNAAVQSILEGGIARATHAMMVATPGYYVDASVRFGVSVVPARLFCMDGVGEAPQAAGAIVPAAAAPRPLWRRRLVGAYRHPALADAPDRERALLQAIAEQLGQPYNLRFIFKRVRAEAEDKTAFCSELVARTFARLGLPIVPERRYARVLPHTLMRHLSRHDWVDVSDDYRDGLPRAFAA